MKKTASLLILPVAMLLLSGCQTGKKTVYCETCEKHVPVGTYCTKCQMLMGEKGTVHCDKCNMDMPAGKYCPGCNRIMLEGTAKCAGCGAEVPKGSYCAKCKVFVGAPTVGYCEACKAPYDKAEGCPTCTEQKT